jgi:hypothetical protein
MNKNFDMVAFVTDYETNELDEEEIREGFQYLVDSGEAWRLQGMYGRTAAAMLAAGLIHQPGER